MLRGVTQEGLANPDSGGVARPFCRRRGEGSGAELRKCPPSPATPSPPVALGFPVWGGAVGTPLLLGHFHPETLLSGTGPLGLSLRLTPRPAPRARSPQSRRGWNVLSSSRGRFLSAMLEADSCHRLRPAEARRGKGVEGRPARPSRVPRDPPRVSPPPALRGRRRPRPAAAPPPRRRPGCVTRRRPRGPGRVPGVRGGGGWGGGGKRPRGERPAPGPARRRPRFPLPGAAGGAGGRGGEPASKLTRGRRRPRAAAAGAPLGRRAGGAGGGYILGRGGA